MKKQYIILDTNSYGTRMLHAALAYAEASKYADYADVKIVLTPMLLAEFRRKHELNTKKITNSDKWHGGHADTGQKYTQAVNKKNRHSKPPSSDPQDIITLPDLLEAYSDYIEIAPPSSIEIRMQDAIASHLSAIFSHNMHKFYDILDTPISILKPEQELPEMMSKDPAFFSKAFAACMSLQGFRDRLARLGMDKNQADESIVAWYEQHNHLAPNTEIFLASADKQVVESMKGINQRTQDHTPGNQHEKLYSFDQRGLARHLLAETGEIQAPSKEEGYSTYLAVKTAKQMCKKMAFTIGSNSFGEPENRTSHRLK